MVHRYLSAMRLLLASACDGTVSTSGVSESVEEYVGVLRLREVVVQKLRAKFCLAIAGQWWLCLHAPLSGWVSPCSLHRPLSTFGARYLGEILDPVGSGDEHRFRVTFLLWGVALQILLACIIWWVRRTQTLWSADSRYVMGGFRMVPCATTMCR
jgi:hypothetical protein